MEKSQVLSQHAELFYNILSNGEALFVIDDWILTLHVEAVVGTNYRALQIGIANNH